MTDQLLCLQKAVPSTPVHIGRHPSVHRESKKANTLHGTTLESPPFTLPQKKKKKEKNEYNTEDDLYFLTN